MSEDINIRVKANTQALNTLFNQVKKLQTSFKNIKKSLTSVNREAAKVSSRFRRMKSAMSAQNKISRQTSQRFNRVMNSMKKLNKNQKNYIKGVGKANSGTKKFDKTAGFTGLTLGFLGASAGFAASQLKDKFIKVLEESSVILSEINRVKLFSDTGIVDGKVSVDGFNKAFQRTIDIGQKFGITLEDAATLLKEVEKAAPSNIDIFELGEIGAGFKVLENEVAVSKLIADFSTVVANFPKQDLQEIADLTFNFSKATKLSFGAGAKTVAFSAQRAKALNADLEEVLRTLTLIVAVVPGDRGNAGRAARALFGDLTEPRILKGLEKLGVAVFDQERNFVGLESVLDGTVNIYNKLKETSDEVANQFKEQLQLSANSEDAFLALANATDEARAAAAKQFENVGGEFEIAVTDQTKQANENLNRLKNTFTELKLEFTKGVAPALADINAAFREVFADSEVSKSIQALGAAIAQDLIGGLKVLLPILRSVAGFFKNNEGAVKLASSAVIGLFVALSSLAVIFGTLGFVAALNFALGSLGISFNLASLSAIRFGISMSALQVAVSKGIARLVALKVFIISTGLAFRGFAKNVAFATKGLIAMSRKGLARVLSGFKELAVRLILGGLLFKGFSLQALKSFAIIAAGWLLVLGPIALLILGLIGVIALIVHFKDSFIELETSMGASSDRLDEVGRRIDALGSLLQGDPGPLFAEMQAEIESWAESFGIFTEQAGLAWNIFIDDLSNSKIAVALGQLGTAISDAVTNAGVAFENFKSQLVIDIDKSWADFLALGGQIGEAFSNVGTDIIAFIESLGFEIPDVWGILEGIWSQLKESLSFILTPLNKFLEAIDFEIPAPLVELQKLIDGLVTSFLDFVAVVAENPIISAGLEILGIVDNFGKNIGKSFENADFNKVTGGLPEQGPPDPNSLLSSFFDPNNPIVPSLNELEESTQQLVITQQNLLFKTTETSDILDEGNELLIAQAEQVSIITNSLATESQLLQENSNLVATESDFERIRIATVDSNIIAMAENTNLINLVTIAAATAQVMFANLVAQGNRAAGKLASLKVSNSGKFSISDPGVSSTDQSFIDFANAELSGLKESLQFINLDELKNLLAEKGEVSTSNVTVNPSITINVDNVSDLDSDELTSKIEEVINTALSNVEVGIQ
jgi:hypothetical protein